MTKPKIKQNHMIKQTGIGTEVWGKTTRPKSYLKKILGEGKGATYKARRLTHYHPTHENTKPPPTKKNTKNKATKKKKAKQKEQQKQKKTQRQIMPTRREKIK